MGGLGDFFGNLCAGNGNLRGDALCKKEFMIHSQAGGVWRENYGKCR